MIKETEKILYQILIIFQEYITMYQQYFKNKYEKVKSKYEFLTPNDNAEQVEEYSLALADALNDEKVKNIAISGSYGSGKSSFIQTFEKNNTNPKFKFLDISLAIFDKNDPNDKPNISLIEKSILEQMFYKVKTKNIPQSRLNKINRLRYLPLKVILTLLVILSFVLVFKKDAISEIIFLKNLVELTPKYYINYIPLLLLFIGAYYLVRKFLFIISNTTIDKLNLKDLELCSNDKNNESLLNKHLDEILYFFERTPFNVVVFQDLDRFENLDIFTKLRELNNFINNSEQINRKVVFLYAVKDEMFTTSHQRTKFFDFLIPIIPYINATNSKEKLLTYFKDDVKHSFLYDVSLYISDMRLLKNVYNEYTIYSSNLNEKLNKTELLAMIIYKNFEPQDFEKLHKQKGLVFGVFNNKTVVIKSIVESLDNEIKSIEKEINKINKEPQNNIRELQQMYLFKIIEKFDGKFNGKIYFNNNDVVNINAIDDDIFKKISNSKNIQSKYTNNSYYEEQFSKSINFKTIEDEINKNYSYKEREQFILDKTNNKKDELLSKIQKIEEEKLEIESYSIKQIIDKYDTDIFNDDFKDKLLLKYLISYGYINKDYSMYMSKFYGVSITKEEQDYLLNIKKNGSHLSFDYQLTNFKEILKKERLEINEFKKEAILNYDLIKYICSNNKDYRKQYIEILKQLSNGNIVSNDFIFTFFDKGKEIESFLKEIIKYYPSLFEYIINNDSFTSKQKDKYFYMILHNLDIDDIIKLNVNDVLKIYMEIKQEFVISEDKFNEKIILMIEMLNIKFKSFKEHTENITPFNFIYENNHYELNQEMIDYIVYVQNEFDSSIYEDLKKSHYTTILNSNADNLKEYIYNNINEYIKNVFLNIDTNKEESERIIIDLLNNEDIDNELKMKIIEKEENKIVDIMQVKNKKLWSVLLSDNKLVSTWNNISIYYTYKKGLDDVITSFLNENYNASNISKVRINKNYIEKNKIFNTKLLKAIMQSNTINTASYENLIKNNGYWYADLSLSELEEEKIGMLVKYNNIQFKGVSFDELKKYSKSQHIALIEKNIDNFIERFEEFTLDTSDVVKLLESKTINMKVKKETIEKIDYDLITNNEIASLIYKIKDKDIVPSVDYINNMVKSLDSLERKVNLILEQNSQLLEIEFINLLNLLPNEYSKITHFDGTQTVLKGSDYNKSFIKILDEREFITSSKGEKKNDIRLFIKNKKIVKSL